MTPAPVGRREPVLSVNPRWPTTEQLGKLEEKFRTFAKESALFRDDILGNAGLRAPSGTAESARLNLEIARTVFSKWSLETMVLLYHERTMGFADLRRRLEGISSRVLSQRLKALQALGFVERSVVNSRPPRVAYVLTYEGHTVSRLATPLFLYLQFRRAYRQRLARVPIGSAESRRPPLDP